MGLRHAYPNPKPLLSNTITIILLTGAATASASFTSSTSLILYILEPNLLPSHRLYIHPNVSRRILLYTSLKSIAISPQLATRNRVNLRIVHLQQDISRISSHTTMSFLGGAECSTAGNPLSQFTKHVQDDKSLQRDRLVGRGPGGMQEGMRSQQMGGGADGVGIAVLDCTRRKANKGCW